MPDQSPAPFAGLLRRLRVDAGLTQEELAAAARLSPRSVSDLERGVNKTARSQTARLLADALRLAGPDRRAFEAVARGRERPGEGVLLAAAAGGAAGATSLPMDIANFTGRDFELTFLLGLAADVARSGRAMGLCAITGMAGVGKTAFAVHAAHRIASMFPDGQVFLSLHGHTPGQRPVDPADALASLLLMAGVAAGHIPAGVEARSAAWRHQMAGKRLVLLLDDAAGHEQVRPLLPAATGSLVLVTSRRNLTALGGARTVSLDVLAPDEAARLLVRLADRPDVGVGDPSAGQITSLCGQLPLAIGMLARQLHHHPAWTTARLAADLGAARDRLEFMHAENVSVAAAFDLSYADLNAEQQRLFRRLGLHPGSDIDAYAAAALAGTGLRAARRGLEDLYDQHLLTEPGQGRYRLHDLIREHARTRAAADKPADRRRAFRGLLDYFAHTACAAGAYPVRRSPGNVPAAPAPPPACAPDLPTFSDAVRWMATERVNLHAAVAEASAQGRHGHVVALAAAMHGFLRSHGYWDQALALDQLALAASRAAGDQLAEAGALTDLGEMRDLTADYAAAQADLGAALELCRELGSRLGEAAALNELGVLAQAAGDNPAAAVSHERALCLYHELGHALGEAGALNELGLVQHAMADYPAAAASHERALRLYRELGGGLGEASALNRLGHVQRTIGDFPAAVASNEQALRLHRELGGRLGEASALNGLAIVRRATGDLAAAVACGEEALRLYRDLGYRLGEAHALIELAAARRAAGELGAALAFGEDALRLYRGLGARLGEANALVELAAARRAAGELGAALEGGEEALRLYRDLGYRLGEADALSNLARAQLASGDHGPAAEGLAAAVAAFRVLGVRIGEAEAMNTMGELELAQSATPSARADFERAREIAAAITCAAEQARALVGIGRCLLAGGDEAGAAAAFGQARQIRGRIGSAAG